jgi:hypothetical protein
MQVGDIVKVKNIGLTYDLYEKLAWRLDAENWIPGEHPNNESVYEIVNEGFHSNGRTLIFLIKDTETNEEFLVSEKGLEIHEINFIKDDDILIHL